MKTTQPKQKSDGKWMRRIQRLLAGVLLLILIGVTVYFGVRRIRERLKPIPPVPRQPLAVETVIVKPSRFTISRRYSGSIVSTKHALISAQVTGRVNAIYFREGARVKKGELLIRLDDTALRADIGRLEATSKRIQVDLDFWRLQDARDEKLLRAKAIPSKKRDESKRMADSLEASLQANEFALAAARDRLAHTQIHAPFSGSIQRLDTEIGELAVPGKPLLDLIATHPLKVVCSVPQKDLPEIREKMTVRLDAPSLSRTIISTIDHVYPALDTGSRNATFDARLSSSEEGLRPGMAVDVTLIMATYDSIHVLPRSAIRVNDGDTTVYIIEKNVARRRSVRMGQTQNGYARIISGLSDGDIVIITPDPRLKEGIRVQARNNWRHIP